MFGSGASPLGLSRLLTRASWIWETCPWMTSLILRYFHSDYVMLSCSTRPINQWFPVVFPITLPLRPLSQFWSVCVYDLSPQLCRQQPFQRRTIACDVQSSPDNYPAGMKMVSSLLVPNMDLQHTWTRPCQPACLHSPGRTLQAVRTPCSRLCSSVPAIFARFTLARNSPMT